MSGFEAVFGAVSAGAGLLALSIQLGESAMKLKRLYQAAKDASSTIERLLFDLETMSLALGQLEQHRRHDTHSEAPITRCITQCQQCVQDVQQLVDNLERCLTKHARLRGRVYAAFKERDVKELLDDLERAKSSLNLAYTMYMGIEQQRRHQEHRIMLSSIQDQVTLGSANISQQLTLLKPSSKPSPQRLLNVPKRHPDQGNERLLTATSEPYTMSTAGAHNHSERCNGSSLTAIAKRNNGRLRLRAQFGFPAWLSSRVWDVALVGAQSGWNIQIRTYHLVPHDSPIFKYCEAGYLPGVRRLIESGKASPLDVVTSDFVMHGHHTLLEAAADYGNIEICRYLLSLAIFPDQAAVLNSSLKFFILRILETSDIFEDGYCLFMAAPGFDADIDDPSAQYAWLEFCPNARCFNVIVNHQDPEFFGRPVTARFDLAVKLKAIPLSDLLNMLGRRQTDRELAHIRDGSGITALYYVACRLSALSYEPGSFKEWLDFGVCLLRNGADPCSKAMGAGGHDGWLRTPLLELLNVRLWLDYMDDLSTVKNVIEGWINMLQVAGVDLLQYGAKESKIWESYQICLKFDEIGYRCPARTSGLLMKRLLHGPTLADWGFDFWRVRTARVYKLQKLPGSYPSGCDISDRIMWEPTQVEKTEGPWTVVATKILVSAAISSRQLASRSQEPFLELTEGTLDDLSVIVLLQQRATLKRKEEPSHRRRSISQPPILRRREVAYCAQQETYNRGWLDPCHLCPFDSRWKFGCHRGDQEVLCDNHSWDLFDVRSCALGLSLYGTSVQASWSWMNDSFLSNVARCRDKRLWARNIGDRGHTGTAACPWRCASVPLDRLHVPKPLRPYHPQRWFEDS